MKKNKASLKSKIKRKLHWIVFSKLRLGKSLRPYYKSVRHSVKYKNNSADKGTVYFTEIPNDGAGIGHQLAGFIGGVHYARIFGCKHACPHFSEKKWDEFFGFYEHEDTIDDLKKQGYRLIKLPYFDEVKDNQLIYDIIQSYAGEKVIICTEQDQFYEKQYEEMPTLKRLFEQASQRKNEKTVYDDHYLNMAVHIRRGDIIAAENSDAAVVQKRFISDDYYEEIVRRVYEVLGEEDRKRLKIYVFSQGNKEDYRGFEKYGHVEYCLDKDAITSFLMMVRADILVTSRSSFSYKPALLNDGVRICPKNFWHGYPDDGRWILADDDGHINIPEGMVWK